MISLTWSSIISAVNAVFSITPKKDPSIRFDACHIEYQINPFCTIGFTWYSMWHALKLIDTLQYIVHTLQPFDAHFVCWRFYPMASFYKIHITDSVIFPTICVHRKYCPCMTVTFPALKRKSSISRISGWRIYFMWRIVIYSSPGLICPGAPFTVEVWEWTSTFIPHFTGYVVTYPCCD